MKFLCCFFFLTLPFLSLNAQVKFVTQSGAGNKDGTSWGNAWSRTIFADTIYSVAAGTEVWIARGIYTARKDKLGQFPSVPSLEPVDSITAFTETTFKVNAGVKLRGGFAGTETLLEDRIDSLMFGANLTFLQAFMPGIPPTLGSGASGMLLTMDNVSDSTLIDGFYLANSTYASIYIKSEGINYSSPVISKCLFGETWDGSMSPVWIDAQGSLPSNPKISNCYFIGGWGLFAGGINVSGNSRLSVANTVFAYCEGGQFDGAAVIFLQNSLGADIVNSTFYDNATDLYPRGAIATKNITDTVKISNCIFYKNHIWGFANTISNLYVTGDNLFSLTNCNFQEQDPAYSSEPLSIQNSFDSIPGFMNSSSVAGSDNVYFTSDDGLSLTFNSPCINKGLNNSIPDFMLKDALGKPRVEGCRVDIGAFEYKSNSAINDGLPMNNYQVCTQYPVSPGGTFYIDTASCTGITNVSPSGPNPVAGILKVCVTRQDTVPVIEGIPYVQRFYDFEPLVNASTSTADITLYYSQEEFDNYNIVATAFPKLPVSPTDLAGIANIRVEQNHGFSLTGEPGTYTGNTVYIDPNDVNIIWNGVAARWEVSFAINGFSGFFLQTNATVLPLSLISFKGNEKNGQVFLKWKAGIEMGVTHFEIQRSRNGLSYQTIGKVDALNSGSYNFTDIQPFIGANFYRLLIVDKNGDKGYSSVLIINIKTQPILLSISPNPAKKNTVISVSGNVTGEAEVEIYHVGGKKISTHFIGTKTDITLSNNLNIEDLPRGIYIIQCYIGKKIVASAKLVVL